MNATEHHQQDRKSSRRGQFVHATLLMALWLVLSGQYDLFHISMGLLSVAVVLWFNGSIQRVHLSADDHSMTYKMRPIAFLRYCGWLLKEIVLSSLQVAHILMRRKLRIEPHLIKVRVKLPNLAAKVLLGNSITLTPGTVTIEMQGDQFYVHALTEKTSASLVDGTMASKVAEIFGARAASLHTDIQIIKSEEDM
jgi:multicomponent Na+:H+ antiporter subunit E